VLRRSIKRGAGEVEEKAEEEKEGGEEEEEKDGVEGNTEVIFF
jgi:hypothetical protein